MQSGILEEGVSRLPFAVCRVPGGGCQVPGAMTFLP